MAAHPPPQNQSWENLSKETKLLILSNADSKSISNLRATSQDNKNLIDNDYGIEVYIPERNFVLRKPFHLISRSVNSKNITDENVKNRIQFMPGKTIRKLSISEMVPLPNFTPFPFDNCIQHPEKLDILHLKYLCISLVDKFLKRCPNLKVLTYQTSVLRPLPRGPLASWIFIGTSFLPVTPPPTTTAFTRKVDELGVPLGNNAINLNNLTTLCLAINLMSFRFQSDWANVAYILLVSPVLPALTTFKFHFKPNVALSWVHHLPILACLGEFLSKTPQLKILQYHSNFSVANSDNEVVVQDWKLLTASLFNKHGSQALKNVALAISVQIPNKTQCLNYTLQLFQNGGFALFNLRQLDILVMDTTENRMFHTLISHIRSPHLETFGVFDKSWTFQDHVQTDAEEKVNPFKIYKHCTWPDLQGSPLISRPMGLGFYQRITRLSVEYTFIQGLNVSLAKMLEIFVQLKALRIKNLNAFADNEGHPAEIVNQSVHDNPAMIGPNLLRLEELSLTNIRLSGLDEDNCLGKWLASCKNLRSVEVQHETKPDGVQFGIPVKYLTNLVGLRSLEKVKISPVFAFVNRAGIPYANRLLKMEDGERVEVLKQVGKLEETNDPWRWQSIDRNNNKVYVVDYDFTFEF